MFREPGKYGNSLSELLTVLQRSWSPRGPSRGRRGGSLKRAAQSQMQEAVGFSQLLGQAEHSQVPGEEMPSRAWSSWNRI